LAGFERFDPKMKREDDERRGKEDETGRTKRIQLRIFGLRTLLASRFGLRAVHVLSVCRLHIGQMA
jgi:hypothetical protein